MCPAARLPPESDRLCRALSSRRSILSENADGMAEGAFHMVYSVPSVLLFDEEGREVKSWKGDVPEQKELQKNLLV